MALLVEFHVNNSSVEVVNVADVMIGLKTKPAAEIFGMEIKMDKMVKMRKRL